MCPVVMLRRDSVHNKLARPAPRYTRCRCTGVRSPSPKLRRNCGTRPNPDRLILFLLIRLFDKLTSTRPTIVGCDVVWWRFTGGFWLCIVDKLNSTRPTIVGCDVVRWRFTGGFWLCIKEWDCVSGMRAFVEVLCVVEYFGVCMGS